MCEAENFFFFSNAFFGSMPSRNISDESFYVSENSSTQVYSSRLPLSFYFKVEQIYTAAQNHQHEVVPRLPMTAVEQLRLLSQKLFSG